MQPKWLVMIFPRDVSKLHSFLGRSYHPFLRSLLTLGAPLPQMSARPLGGDVRMSEQSLLPVWLPDFPWLSLFRLLIAFVLLSWVNLPIRNSTTVSLIAPWRLSDRMDPCLCGEDLSPFGRDLRLPPPFNCWLLKLYTRSLDSPPSKQRGRKLSQWKWGYFGGFSTTERMKAAAS